MDLFEAIQKRRSVRAYGSTPISKKKLKRILEAARLAPSASNIQPWHFIVVTDSEKRKALSSGKYAKFLVDAPIVIVGCGDQGASPTWCVVDVTIALEHMILAATSEGLGTCWVGSFDEKQVKELLKIPENYKVVALIAVGYPREDLREPVRKRKRLEEIASFEEFTSIV